MSFTVADTPQADMLAPESTPAPIPAPTPAPTASCVACGGTGASSKKKPCKPCAGTGKSQAAGAAPQPALTFNTTHPVPKEVDKTLVRILEWRRPFQSDHEVAFMQWLRDEIKERGYVPSVESMGCLVVRVPMLGGARSTTLFSCHTDTVHSQSKERQQKLVYDAEMGYIYLDSKAEYAHSDKPNCLGADDGVGVWIMLEMIRAKVPGTYIFHRGEERGGVGANAMLRERRALLAEHQIAVAFDRPRTNEVITHQGGQRCCSEKFAQALAKALNDANSGFDYKPSSGGVFTDTKVYRGVIEECTNLGVGYENQHGPDELLDYAHAVALRNAACVIKWEALPVDRDPEEDDYKFGGYGAYRAGYTDDYGSLYGSKYGKQESFFPPEDKSAKKPKKGTVHTLPTRSAPSTASVDLDPVAEVEGTSFTDLMVYCENTPDDAARLLVQLAAEVTALREKVRFLSNITY